MPKLYYTPISCGAASFIAAFTAKVQLKCEQVDLHGKEGRITAGGVDFWSINPKGNVPCLVLDDGTVLNENIAVLQYIADQVADGELAPSKGTVPYYLLLNVMSYTATEVHQAFAGLLHAPDSKEVRTYLKNRVTQKLTYLENYLIPDDSKFLVGDSFTIADSYLYIVLSWTSRIEDLELTPWPRVTAYFERIGELENVKAAQSRMATSPQTIL